MKSKEAAKLEYENNTGTGATHIEMKGSNISHSQRQKLQNETAREKALKIYVTCGWIDILILPDSH